jgi:hypothetical protein
MLPTKDAWAAVTSMTIKNCCDHTQIQLPPSQSTSSDSSPCTDTTAWSLIREFATTDMTLLVVEKRLEEHFGNQYADKDWRPALNAVLEAEGDVVKAQEAIRGLASSCHLPRLTIKLPA